jgi:hypothetical protein
MLNPGAEPNRVLMLQLCSDANAYPGRSPWRPKDPATTILLVKLPAVHPVDDFPVGDIPLGGIPLANFVLWWRCLGQIATPATPDHGFKAAGLNPAASRSIPLDLRTNPRTTTCTFATTLCVVSRPPPEQTTRVHASPPAESSKLRPERPGSLNHRYIRCK